MKTSRDGIELIAQFEGLRTKAYRDPIGIWTIGYGHTAAAGEPKPKAGMVITKQDARDILTRDLVAYEAAVQRALRRVPTQSQFDAMVSLCFNVGPGNFSKSSVLRKFNSGDFVGAAKAFALWNKAGGRVLPGLTRRRAAEAALFSRGKPRISQSPPPAPVTPQTQQPAPAAKSEAPKGIWNWLVALFTKSAA